MLRRIGVSVGIFLVAGVTILTTTVLPGSVVFAATAAPAATPTQPINTVNNGNGLKVSPVRTDLKIKPGESQIIDIYVQNVTNSPAELKVIINDLASDDESGQPRILLDENDSAPSHSLKAYVAKISNFSLQPQEQKIIKVRVAIPANAAGGGYFGAVRFAPTSSNSGKNVSLSASVASLLLVTVPGDIKEQVGIDSFHVVRDTTSGKASSFFTNGSGLSAVIRFKNSGNVQEAPFGKIVVKRSGKTVGTFEVNNTTPRGSILPDSVRRFTAGLGNQISSIGKYTVEGNFGYGTGGQLVSASTSFVVLPTTYIVIAVLLLIAIILAVVAFPRMMRSHDRKLLRKVRRGRK
jgi:hypothetical protein